MTPRDGLFERRIFLGCSIILFLISIFVYISTKPKTEIDVSFLMDSAITPSKDFMEQILTQNPRLKIYLTYLE